MAPKRTGLGARRGAIATALAVSDDAPAALSGEVLPALNAEPSTAVEYADAIRGEWLSAQQSFMRIGAMLERAKQSLGSDGYLDLCSTLPFGKAVRSQLMTSYRAIQSRKVPDFMVPAGYTTIHLLASLSDAELSAAADAGLLRPDVKRAEIRALRASGFGRPNRTPSPAPQTDRRAELEARRARLMAELAEVERELAALT